MRILTITATAVLVLLCGHGSGLAQSPPTPVSERRFDVASVKPAVSPAELGRLAAQSGGQPPMRRFGIDTQPGGRFTAATSTLKQLIAEAFEVRDYQIEGGPTWLGTDYFDIAANAGAHATPADIKAMLRTLLAERFGLRVHEETRQAPVYVLTVARSDGRLGSRLKPTSSECVQQLENRRTGGGAPPQQQLSEDAQREQRNRMESQVKRLMSGDSSATAPCGSSMMGNRATGASTYLSSGAELKSLVSRISSELSAPVVDETGLSGLFDVALEFLSERRLNGRAPGLDPNSTEPLPPPLAGALQQQLGLQLDKEIGPMRVVIVDAAAHPTPD
jgi:uncharacterized protein (TIGR03435 family)